MNFLCLAYYDEAKFDALSKPELDEIVRKCRPLDEELHQTGRVKTVASLASPGAATILRPKNGTTVVTDGPFAESKEQVGAFFLIEASDRDEAIRIASKHPAARLGEDLGWSIEVRPIEHFQER